MEQYVDNENDKRSIFECVDVYAASDGKVNVLKWLETKRLSIDKERCAKEAARHAQLHILKWLKDEKNLQLKSELCGWAVVGGQLHVMKWLREQEVDWDEWTFHTAARTGNLDILQWLHDEGCPWRENYRVSEREPNPQALEWLRSNGYGNRIW